MIIIVIIIIIVSIKLYWRSCEVVSHNILYLKIDCQSDSWWQ